MTSDMEPTANAGYRSTLHPQPAGRHMQNQELNHPSYNIIVKWNSVGH